MCNINDYFPAQYAWVDNIALESHFMHINIKYDVSIKRVWREVGSATTARESITAGCQCVYTWTLDMPWCIFTRLFNPDSKVHGANMGPIWGRQDPGGPHVGPMNLALWEVCQVYMGIWEEATNIMVFGPVGIRRFCWASHNIVSHPSCSKYLYRPMVNCSKGYSCHCHYYQIPWSS